MNAFLVKVCGLRAPDNIAEVAALEGVSRIGYVFHPASPRVLDRTAERLDRLPWPSPRPRRVGVFVDQPVDAVLATASIYGLDAVQLHGREHPSDGAALARYLPVIRALRVGGRFPAEEAARWEGIAEHFLFDTAGPAPGGNGTRFRWSLLEAYAGATPFLLAGGLGPDAVEALAAFSHPRWAGVDLNSGFETAPGWKDADALRRFLDALRAKRLLPATERSKTAVP
jgi:phosphoribosylanthranilate isomerase